MTILGIICQRGDTPFLAEWLARHLAAGFDQLLAFSHDCADGSDAHSEALAQAACQERHRPTYHMPMRKAGA